VQANGQTRGWAIRPAVTPGRQYPPRAEVETALVLLLEANQTPMVEADGAMTATMHPHLTGLKGVLLVCKDVGRAPMYSALKEDFIERLVAMQRYTCLVYPFKTVDIFHAIMEDFIATSVPCMPPSYCSQQQSREEQ